MSGRAAVARAVLALDAAGCVGAALAVAAVPGLVERVDAAGRARVPLAVALGLTSALLASGTVRRDPTRRALALAGLVNVGWTITCLMTFRSRPTRTGSVLVATTALLDATAAAAQIALARSAD